MDMTQAQLRGVSAVDGSTKAKIERAALTLFAQHGIDGVSTKQIAGKAGISEGAIYRHFAGKEDLARALMAAIHHRLTDMIASAVHGHPTLQTQITFIITHYCQIADDDWTLFQYHILHLHHFPRLSEGVAESPITAAADLIKAAIARGEITPNNPYILAAMALGVVLQTAQAKVFGYVDGPLSQHIDMFTTAVFAVLNIQREG